MSSKLRTRTLIGTGSIAAVAAAGIVLAAVVVPSGANFNDAKSAHVSISSATLKVDTRVINLSFANLKPGEVQHQDFTVTNNGSIDAVATLGSNFTNSTPGTNLDYSKLSIGVSGISGLIPVTQLSHSADQFTLGTVKAGETKTYTVDVSLDQSAGNEWQGQSFGGDVPVTLTQQ